MIRKATKYDIDHILKMLKHYRDVSILKETQSADNQNYIFHLLSEIFAGKGIVLLAEKEEVIGMVMALIMPNFWNPKVLELHELVYWVEPKYRGSTAGYRLLKAYCDFGNELKENGRISNFSISKSVKSPDIKYEKFGFSKLEEKWVI